MNFLKSNRAIIFLCAATFVAPLAYSFYFRIPPLVDARAYDRISWNLAQGLGYREKVGIDLLYDNSIIRVGPGYEFFLAALYWIFGHHAAVVWVLQAALLAGSAFLIYLVSKKVFQSVWHESIGLVSAALIGFSPDLITMSAMLMTETLAIFLATLSLYLFFRYTDYPTLGNVMLFGFVSGAAALVRTPLLLLLIPTAGFIILQRRYKDVALLIVVLVVMFAPWTIRNYQAFGVFLPTNAASGVNMLAGNHPGASGEQEPYEVLARYAVEYDYIEANQRANADARTFIFWHPFEYIILTLKRISIYFSFARPTGFWFHLHGFSKAATLVLSVIYSIILFTFGFFGVARLKYMPKENRTKARLLLTMLIMMPLAVVGIIVETRYRFLSYPFFALFAGYGISEIRKKNACWTCFAGVFFILFANTAFDIARNFDRIIERLHGL